MPIVQLGNRVNSKETKLTIRDTARESSKGVELMLLLLLSAML